ncbi:hypothetical protein [Bifidobacterium pseudolongum]|uniref:hypothetical protein n=1 Tax=Bifidobacterium pseudolongum TaxID=1694 RepID=UPI0010226599|nr:hypothetical protein [Bifidobacterium pseudolongum]
MEHGETQKNHHRDCMKGGGVAGVASLPPGPAHMLPISHCFAESHYWGVGGEGANIGNVNTNANAYDGTIINDPFELLEFVNGLRQHQLRAGRGGDNPGRKDAHGNTIYRCNVHGQYRLRFTRNGAERVTFLSVNTHGDLLL